MFRNDLLQRRFDRAAVHFDSADFVHTATRDGLFDRLDGLTVEAQTVVDLGTATGTATRQLRKQFKGSQVIALDLSLQMLKTARRKKKWFARSAYLQSDAAALPFSQSTVDVVFSNLLLPWAADPEAVFTEVARVLRPEGVFTFATLGPDSFHELAAAWATVDPTPHVSPFADMHNLGDALVRAGLRDPVLDVDRLKISYSTVDKLFTDLTAVGARNALIDRKKTLTGRRQFSAMTRALERGPRGDVVLDLELVFGHCWGAGPRKDPGNWRVDAGSIPIRRRRS